MVMKSKEQIEIAQKIIANLQDYVELAKVEKKLKPVNVDLELETVEVFIKTNVEKL